MAIRFPLVGALLPQAQFDDRTTHRTMNDLLTRVNSMCTGYITPPSTVTFGDNVSSVSKSATGIYVVTLGISYADTNQYAAIVTPIHASTDLFPTITATTANTFTVKFSDAAGADTDPTAFMVYVYGKQG